MAIKYSGKIAQTGHTKSVSVVTKDPYYLNTQLLLPCDGDLTNYNGQSVSGQFNPLNITYATGKFGQAASFTGTNSYLNGSAFPALTWKMYRGSDMTFDVWLNPASTGNDQVIFDDGGDAYRGSILRFSDAGAINYKLGQAGDGVGIDATSATGAITFGAWNFLRFTVSSLAFTLNINGTAVITDTIANLIVAGSNSTDLYMGKHTASNTGYYSGLMDDIRLTDGIARSNTEVPSKAFPLE